MNGKKWAGVIEGFIGVWFLFNAVSDIQLGFGLVLLFAGLIASIE